jgi:hypothetical protein
LAGAAAVQPSAQPGSRRFDQQVALPAVVKSVAAGAGKKAVPAALSARTGKHRSIARERAVAMSTSAELPALPVASQYDLGPAAGFALRSRPVRSKAVAAAASRAGLVSHDVPLTV